MDAAVKQEGEELNLLDVAVENQRRLKAAVAAYAIECWDAPPDAYEHLAQNVHRLMNTGRPAIDRFYREEYTALSTDWVRDHPEIDKIESIYRARIGV